MASTDINSVVLVGRVVRDSELAYIPSGSAALSFSIAVNRSIKKGDQWEAEASYIDCVYFGKPAESIKQYMTKGRLCAVNGSLKQDRWEKDGVKNSKIKVMVSQVQLLGGIETKAASAESKPEIIKVIEEIAGATAQADFLEDIPF